MKCPECCRQYSRFADSPAIFQPTGELICPHCDARLRVGWWPLICLSLLAVVTVLAMGASLWFGIGDWIIHDLLGSNRRAYRVLARIAVAVAVGAAIGAPGSYAVWIFGFYGRRPADPNGPTDGQGR